MTHSPAAIPPRMAPYIAGLIRRYSPGLLLLHHRIEQAIREGLRTIDLLQGAQPYKLAWSSEVRRSVTLRLYNRSVRALALKLLDSAKQAMKILVR